MHDTGRIRRRTQLGPSYGEELRPRASVREQSPRGAPGSSRATRGRRRKKRRGIGGAAGQGTLLLGTATTVVRTRLRAR